MLECIKNYITDGEAFKMGNTYPILEDCGDNSFYTISNEGNKTWLDLSCEEVKESFNKM